MADGMRTRACGCVTFEFGPPVPCEKHRHNQHTKERRELCRRAVELAAELHHELNDFSEYKPGKWTAFCTQCGLIVIVYDSVPPVGDQIAGWALSRRCTRSNLMKAAATEARA